MSEGVPNAVIDWWQEDEEPVFGPQYPPNFQQSYSDSTLKSTYTEQKEVIADTYGVEPGKFIGYLEESSDLWSDVKNASEETGVDPNLLYSIGMQEGFGSSKFWKKEEPGTGGIFDDVKDWWNNEDTSEYMSMGESYKSKEWIDTYSDVGLDTFFNTQNQLLQQGYLDSEIIPQNDFLFDTTNEAKLAVKSGEISKQDGWRATGALIRQNESWMKNSFNNRGVDWEGLSQQEKTFWTYASFNGGPGLAMKIYDKYNGSMDEAIQYRKDHKDMINKKGLEASNYYEDPDNWGEIDHINYLDNILRVTGAENLLEVHNPFQFEYYE